LPLLAVAVIGAVGGLVDRFVAPPRVVFRLVILGALPACALVTAGERHRHAERPDIRSAAAYLREHLEDGDAVGVLPRFFYSALVVDEVSAGRIDFQRAFGFARLPLGQADRADPMVWLPADDREFPLPEALENRAFHRVWVLDFQEREFGLLELSPVVSRRVTSHMDAGHTLLERRSFDQLVLSLYRLDRRRESWAGGPWVMNEANWREHARDVSWSTDGDRLVYRIDLPTADVTRLAELALTFPAADQPHAATRTDLTISAGIDTALDLPADEATRTVQFVAPEGQPLILRLDYPKDRARVPTQVSLRTVAGVF
jgi:hypothetical protein